MCIPRGINEMLMVKLIVEQVVSEGKFFQFPLILKVDWEDGLEEKLIFGAQQGYLVVAPLDAAD